MQKGATEVSFERFRSEDGVFVERSVEDYRTREQASGRLDEIRHGVSKVNYDGDKRDFQSRAIGRRIECFFAGREVYLSAQS